MKVTLRYFAVLRELTGKAQEELTCDDDATVADVLALVEVRHPSLEGRTQRVSVAVNRDYADLETRLSEGAEIALLPPVAGGAPTEKEKAGLTARFQIRETPLRLDEAIKLVQGDFGGAIATFTGIVREQTGGRAVRHLEYEAYPEMAVQELHKINAQIEEQWPVAQVAIHHRIGHLDIGDAAVVIAVCTPHRQESFAACSYAIETLKQTVPIWKREVFQDGESWVGWGP